MGTCWCYDVIAETVTERTSGHKRPVCMSSPIHHHQFSSVHAMSLRVAMVDASPSFANYRNRGECKLIIIIILFHMLQVQQPPPVTSYHHPPTSTTSVGCVHTRSLLLRINPLSNWYRNADNDYYGLYKILWRTLHSAIHKSHNSQQNCREKLPQRWLIKNIIRVLCS